MMADKVNSHWCTMPVLLAMGKIFIQKYWLSRHLILSVYLPVFNILFFALILMTNGQFSIEVFWHLSAYIWITLLLCWLVSTCYIELKVLPVKNGLYFFLVYSCCVLFSSIAAYFIMLLIGDAQVTQGKSPVAPAMLAQVEVLLFTALSYIFELKKHQLMLQANFKMARFKRLKSQLNPHMLFNSLNLITSEIEDNPKKAVKIVNELAVLLRHFLKKSDVQLLPLKEEISLIERYLFIQKMRFADRLNYQIDIDESLNSWPFPALTLQPLIENCIVHGFLNKQGTGNIRLRVRSVAGQLCVELEDNGVGFDVDSSRHGKGLDIVKQTLNLLFGDKYEFAINSRVGAGTYVRFMIPAKG
ncbi:sensor histidine kinase [Thalassomonas haliotis]|uniref:histidine kinase n=1 Tax=Thalassomonas haliotis TaxID=485448 RepID=A0ABY7VG61_9GAMM|nr:histidine kinase [Thalassomonas haliotis]WDE12011.1 histidine kinase [Thalassomonas haliotis]